MRSMRLKKKKKKDKKFNVKPFTHLVSGKLFKTK